MTFLEQLNDYFRGERFEALAFIGPAGLVLFVLAVAAMKSEGGPFGVGVAVPCVIFGLLLVGTGLGVGLRTAGQMTTLEADFASSPKVMVEKELPRMRKVNANWPLYLSVWTALVVAGLVLRFALKADWAHAAGPALLLIGAFGFLIDGFAERRARPYTKALEALAAEHGVPTK